MMISPWTAPRSHVSKKEELGFGFLFKVKFARQKHLVEIDIKLYILNLWHASANPMGGPKINMEESQPFPKTNVLKIQFHP